MGADLYLGPIYTWGAIGGRTDFYAWKPIFLDYSYNFAVRNFRHGYFGNVTKVRNAQQVKNSESFFSTGVGMPLTHRSLLTLRANAGHINYRYDSDVLFADDTDHSRFSFFGLRAGVARNTLDKFLYPRRGSELHLSAIYVAGRDKYQPYDAKDFGFARNQTVVRRAFFVGQVLRCAGRQLVLVRFERRCRVDQPPAVPDRIRDPDVDARLCAPCRMPG